MKITDRNGNETEITAKNIPYVDNDGRKNKSSNEMMYQLFESIGEILDSASKVPFSNLKTFMKQLRQQTNGSTVVRNEDGSRVLTSTTTYGQEMFYMEWGELKPTKALVISKAKFSEGIGRISTYSFKDSTNLNENGLWQLSRKVDGYDYTMKLCGIPSEANIFAPSPVILPKSGVTAEYTDMSFVILDGSDMTNDDCVELFEQLTGTESGIAILSNIEKWKEFPLIYNTALTAQTAKTALTAQTAKTALTAQTAKTAQIKENEIAVEYSEWLSGNRPLTKNEDGSYDIQPRINYGAIMIIPPTQFKVEKKYLIVWNRKGFEGETTNAFSRGAFLTSSKWDYAEDTPQYIDNEKGNFTYSVLVTPSTPSTDLTKCYIIASYPLYQTHSYRFVPYGVYELDLDFDVTKESVEEIISGGIGIYNTIENHEERILDLENESAQGSWKGRKVLVIGDSITAARQWQNQLHNILGMEVSTHAKGGIGMIKMVDGELGLAPDAYDNVTDASGTIYPLNTTDVGDKDLIIFLGGYNNRSLLAGSLGDVYPTNNTFSGQLQYCINRIYEELTKANNLTCRVMVGTMHCFGKYPYVDADGYEEYPTGSGQTAKTLCEKITEVAHGNNVAVCDLYNESGIGKFTWKVFGANPEPYIENPSSTTTPYPHNGDQLHCSALGYKRIGECMCGAVIKAFGN